MFGKVSTKLLFIRWLFVVIKSTLNVDYISKGALIIDSLGVSHPEFNFYYDWDKQYRHSIYVDSNWIGFDFFDKTSSQKKASLLLRSENLFLVNRTSGDNWQAIATETWVNEQITGAIATSY